MELELEVNCENFEKNPQYCGTDTLVGVYPANFESGHFTKQRDRELNRLGNDECTVQREGVEDSHKLKYITTNHRDLVDAADFLPNGTIKPKNYYGITVKNDLFVPAREIDRYNKLVNGQEGKVLSNLNVPHYGYEFPVFVGYRGNVHRGPVNKEMELRSKLNETKKTCNPKDTHYHENRSFEIFNPEIGIQVPNGLDSVVAKHPDFFGPRGGISTRFQMTTYNEMGRTSSQ